MESTKKHIEDNYQDILVLENYEISKYFNARYVLLQHGSIKAIFVKYKKLVANARDFYALPGGKYNTTFFFDDIHIYKVKPDQYIVNEVEKIESKDEIYKLFSKDKEDISETIIDQEIKITIEKIINLQKYAIVKNGGEKTLSSLLNSMRINYFDLKNVSFFMHNIKFKDFENKLIDISITFNSGIFSSSPTIKIRENYNETLLNYFEIDLLKNYPNYDYERLRRVCDDYQDKLNKAEYLISMIY
jgi:hypothetical protein